MIELQVCAVSPDENSEAILLLRTEPGTATAAYNNPQHVFLRLDQSVLGDYLYLAPLLKAGPGSFQLVYDTLVGATTV